MKSLILLVLPGMLAWLSPARAQPTVVSTVPANMASDVSPIAPVVIAFSTAMDTNATTAEFDSLSGLSPVSLPVTVTWNAGGTRMTNTPTPAFPVNKMIFWTVNGQDTLGNELDDANASVFFTTGSSTNGSGGNGDTNTFTTFAVGNLQYYVQTNASLPVVDTNEPDVFTAGVFLASNRTVTSISLKLPTGTVTNLAGHPMLPWEYFETIVFPTPAALQAACPDGNYVFTVQAPISNQTMTVTLSTSPQQPNAPQINNFAAAEAVDPDQPFTLHWNAFTPLEINNFIMVEVGGAEGRNLLFSNTLPGTATSLVIPAGTLGVNATNYALIEFDNISGVTNASYATVTARASLTSFTLVTGSGGSGAASLMLTNAAWSKTDGFSFDILSTPGQPVVAERSADLVPGHFSALCTNNCVSNSVHVTDPEGATNGHLFYRARTGP